MDEIDLWQLPPLPLNDPLRMEVEQLLEELRQADAACGALVSRVVAAEAKLSRLKERHAALSEGEWAVELVRVGALWQAGPIASDSSR